MSRPFDALRLRPTSVQLIEASAGTGKTYSIATLYLRCILEQRLSVDRILVVTFTEAATAELHERIRARLQAAVHAFQRDDAGRDPVLAALLEKSENRRADTIFLQKALADIDEAAITTIHGFCHRMLQQGAFEGGASFDLELVQNIDNLLQEVVEDSMTLASHREDARFAALHLSAYTTEQLLMLAREAFRHRHFPVALSPDLVDDIAALQAQAFDSYGKVRKVWQQEKKEIGQLLTNVKGLTKGFRKRLANGLLEQLDHYLVENEPVAFSVPAATESLVPEKLADPRAKVLTATAVKNGEIPDHAFFRLWARYLEALSRLTDSSCARYLRRLIDSVRAELPRRMVKAQILSFDDLLYDVAQAVESKGGAMLAQLIRRRYPVALIDEFQDTDPVQYRIFQVVYGDSSLRTTLYLIGDPKQAIYAFRGADIYAYLRAAGDVGENSYTMATNWRADRDMITALNALFGPMDQPFFEKRITYPPVEASPGAQNLWQGGAFASAPLQFLSAPRDLATNKQGRIPDAALQDATAELTAADIAALLHSGARLGRRRVKPADIAVLVRTNRQAADMQEALQRLGVSAVLQSKASVFASREAKDLLHVMQAVAQPTDEAFMRAALVTDYFGKTGQELLALEGREDKWQEIRARFFRWHLSWRDHGFMRMIREFTEGAAVAKRLLAYGDGERRLTNLRHLAELLHAAEKERHFRMGALLNWFLSQRRQKAGPEEAELRLESDAEAVQLLTIHKSKGLEFPIVYCPYLWERARPGKSEWFFGFHDPRDDWAGKIALFPSAEQKRFRQQEFFGEGLRLLYVALTRAKHCCMVLWGGAAGYTFSPLAYLLHGPDAPPETLSSLESWFAHLDAFSHERLHEALVQRGAETPCWAVRPIAPERKQPLAKETTRADSLQCRSPARRLRNTRRIGSFSQLAAKADDARRPDMERDHDERIPAEAPAGANRAELPLARFPKGASAGNFFHKILEVLSFENYQGEEARVLIHEQLRLYGYPSSVWLEAVQETIRNVLTTPLLPDNAFCLGQVLDEHRISELAFTFPVSRAAGETLLSSRRLSAAFLAHPAGLPPEYPQRLTLLNFPSFAGYLKGFIDLVFEHNGRWYVVDYKSNHLGDRYEEYRESRLMTPMIEHHYFLQYHIYTVALHRYLRLRLARYDYDRHFGGVFYLFIKGMQPGLGPSHGVFFDRPPRERIDLLSEIFSRENHEPA